MQEIIFDMEVYPNWWCLVHSNPENTSVGVITSDDRDYLKKISEIRIAKCLIGFNIKGYDLRILNAIINKLDPKDVHACSRAIIDKTEHIYNNFYFWNDFNFTDLYDDWMFGSLKEFESNMGMPIVETSIEFTRENLSESDKQEIIRYCKHDVKATCKLLEKRREYVDSKKVLAKMFNIKEHIALKGTSAKLSSTILNAIPAIYQDETRFYLPEKVRTYVEELVPRNILDMFTYLDDYNKTAELFDNEIRYGKGGIHSIIGKNIFAQSDEDNILINIDGENYYPMLSINFNLLSRNVVNPEKYKEIVMHSRQLKAKYKAEYKLNGETELYTTLYKERSAIKLILNATYGAEKNQYNKLFDPYNATSMCYLGQILLTALANDLYKHGATIIQTNTDGVLVKIPRSKIGDIRDVVDRWVALTNIPVGLEEIENIYQRDVNNYIEIEKSFKQKLVGKWSNQAEEKMNNLNAPITHKALLNFYTKGIPVEKTVMECQDPIDFCFTAKTGYTYEKTYYYIDDRPVLANKVNRVMATTDTKYGTIKKYKKYWRKKDENDDWVNYDERVEGSEECERYDKVAEIPENSMLMNDELYLPDTLDRDWYIKFTKKKIKELRVI